MGPDEFHEKYPGAKFAGINNNAYTNIMVAWLLEKSKIYFVFVLSHFKLQ